MKLIRVTKIDSSVATFERAVDRLYEFAFDAQGESDHWFSPYRVERYDVDDFIEFFGINEEYATKLLGKWCLPAENEDHDGYWSSRNFLDEEPTFEEKEKIALDFLHCVFSRNGEILEVLSWPDKK